MSWNSSGFVAALSLVLLAGRSPAATLCVNPGGTGGCFASIQSAVDSSVDTDVIDVAAGTYVENVTIAGPSLTLQGAGIGVTVIDGSAGPGLVTLSSSSPELTLTGISLRNGEHGLSAGGDRVEVSAVEVTNNISFGILAGGTKLTLTDSSVIGNGGTGIWIDRARVFIAGSTIRQNGGLGVSAYRSHVKIDRSVIESNDAGIDIFFGRLTVTDSTIAQNNGIGIRVACARAPISGTTVASNMDRGVILTYGTFPCATSLRCTNCTVSGNGGGIGVGQYSKLVLRSSTVAANVASSGTGGVAVGTYSTRASATSTIFADNTGPFANDCSGQLTSRGSNLIEDPTACTVTGTGNVTGVDPMLGPLADNGGPTPTQALLAGSAAIDAGSSRCPQTDQRGMLRDGLCDIGAYEAP